MKEVRFCDKTDVRLIESYKISKNLRSNIEPMTRILRREIPYYEDIRYLFMKGPLKDISKKILSYNEIVSLTVFKSNEGFDNMMAHDFFKVLETTFNKHKSTLIIESDRNMIIFNDNTSEYEPIVMDSEFTLYNI